MKIRQHRKEDYMKLPIWTLNDQNMHLKETTLALLLAWHMPGQT